jgi:uncharacterized OB-fold protein
MASVPSFHGSRCTECGEVVFPEMRDCPNCAMADVMLPVRIKGEGTIRDFIAVQRGPQNFHVPYVQAYVQLDDGPVVYCSLLEMEPSVVPLTRGEHVQLQLAVIPAGGDEEVIGWAIRPGARRHA